MRKLIDADVLSWAIRENAPKTVPLWVYQTIDKQPTAYDVNKVVRQLEEIRPEEDCFDNAEEYKHALSRHNKIIEIVKGGGVDGN